MRVADGVDALRSFASERGLDLDALTAVDAQRLFLDWYVAEPAVEVASTDGDGLVFDWGVDEDADGAVFSFRCGRQLRPLDPGAGPWHVSVELLYVADERARTVEGGSRWCWHPDRVEELRDEFHNAPVTRFVRSTTPISIDVWAGEV